MKLSEIVENLIRLSKKYGVLISVNTEFDSGGIFLKITYAYLDKKIERYNYIPFIMQENYKDFVYMDVDYHFKECVKELTGKEIE